MSTILRALKKLEHEKASSKPTRSDIDLEFLGGLPSTAGPRRSPLKTMLMIALLLACGSAGTYLFMTLAENKKAPSPPAAFPVRHAISFGTATSVLSSAVVLANRSGAVSPHIVSATTTEARQKPALAPPERQPEKTPSNSLSKKVSLRKQRLSQAAKPPKTPIWNTPLTSLTVNGIAFFDGEKRKAIVNGMSVSVGSVVEGARVEDIRENGVRFSRGNRKFEISVGNSGE